MALALLLPPAMRAPALLVLLTACTGEIVLPGAIDPLDPIGGTGTGGGTGVSATYDPTFTCDPAANPLAPPAALATTSCLKTFVDAYGQKAFRRPITTAEETDLIAFYNSLGADALAGTLARLMMHPRMFYVLENEGAKLSGTDGVDAVYQ